jgi:putative pyruvate formate lyase activating enzyme
MSDPSYLTLLRSGELAERVRQAYRHLGACDLCGRRCGVNRRASARGAVCRTREQAMVASYGPHHGEEDALRGWRGSGTIFFTWCNLRCVYCQNFAISQMPAGREIEPEELAAMMLSLQARGCHNVNLVSPTHVVAPILAAVLIAAEAGLRLPLVYNTGGYDSLEALALLDGVIDIYMPDMKYGDAGLAKRYSKVHHYPEVNRAAVKEMHRQVGNLVIDADGLAVRGLLVRHLVLPGGAAGTAAVVRFLAEEISPNTYVNVMAQYHPCHHAEFYKEIDRPITGGEYQQAIQMARDAGLRRLDRRR